MAHEQRAFLTAEAADSIVNESLYNVQMAACTGSSSRGCVRAFGSGALRRAAAAAAAATPGRSSSELANLTSPCAGCSYAIDLTCGHKLRLASFHKYFDCLLPNFPRFQLVHSLRATSGRLCVLVEDGRAYATFAVQALLGGVPADNAGPSRTNHTTSIWRVARPDGGGPAELVLLHTLGAGAPGCVADLPRVPSSTNLAQQLSGPRGSAQAARSTRAIQFLVRRQLELQAPTTPHGGGGADAAQEADSESYSKYRYVLLIQRMQSRTFLNLPAVVDALRKATGVRVRVHFGNESALATLRLFAGAAAVVGTHGAGLVNSLWIPRRACVLEITTHVDDAGKVEWRSCGRSGRDGQPGVLDVRPWNPLLSWSLHILPLLPLLNMNAAEPDALGHPPCTLPSTPRAADPASDGSSPLPLAHDVANEEAEEAGRAAEAGRWHELGPQRCYILSLQGGSTSYFQKRNFSKCKYRLTANCWAPPLDGAGRVRDSSSLDQHLRFLRYVRLRGRDLETVAAQLARCLSKLRGS